MEPYSNGCFGYQMAISSCRHPLVRLSTVHPSVTVDPENRQDNFWMTKFLSSWWRGGTISLRTGGQGHPTPSLTQPYPQLPSCIHDTNCSIINAHFFCVFDSSMMDHRKDQLMDQRTDKASYRVLFPQLKTFDLAVFKKIPELTILHTESCKVSKL